MSAPRIAPGGADAGLTIRITHSFHPCHGRQFPVVTVRSIWGEKRVYCRDQQERLISIPAGWTDLDPPDPVVAISSGRLPFRLEDLLALARLVAAFEQEVPHGC